MTARSPGAFMLSATFHAAIIGLVVLWAMVSDQHEKVTPRVLELVAGEGDNFGANVAPKLGTPGGVKVDVPTPPTPKIIPEPEPEPAPAPKVVEPEPVPVTPAPKPPPTPVTKTAPTPVIKTAPTPAPKAEKKQPTFKQKILYSAWAAQAKAKKEIAKERAAEEKRKREADAAAAKSASRVRHIDGEGIAKGVVGGSTENKVGGAGGKALVADGPVLDRYYAMLAQRVKNALDKPPGLSDDLTVTVRFFISATGKISNVRVSESSGNEEFDRAVVVAFSRVTMPEHPQHKGEDLELPFKTKDAGDR